jgi:hypothetical protein
MRREPDEIADFEPVERALYDEMLAVVAEANGYALPRIGLDDLLRIDGLIGADDRRILLPWARSRRARLRAIVSRRSREH